MGNPLKFEDVADVRAAPGIDGLVFVANDAQVVACARKQPHKLVLWAVGVLVFVHQNVLEAALIALANCRRLTQQAHRFEQQVIEVERVGPAQLLAIDFVDVGDALRLGIGRAAVHLQRVEHVVLCPGNARQHRAGLRLLVVEAEALHRRLYERLLIGFVVDDEVAAQPVFERLDVAAQNPHT